MATNDIATIAGTDANGNAINIPYAGSQQGLQNSNIPVSNITPTVPVTIATPQYKDYNTGLATNNSYVQSAFDTAQTNADNSQAQALAQSQELAKNQAMLGLKGADTTQAYQSTGATDLAGQIRKLNAQSQALAIDTQSKTLAEQNKATGQNITSSAVQRNTTDVTRENFINQANIAMQVAIKTADYNTAKDLADQIVNAKYDKVLADIEAQKTNLQGIKDFLVTPAQKKAADARETLLKKQEQDIADKKANDSAVSKLLIDASQVAPADVLTRAKDIQAKGGTASEVAMALGKYGGDYLKNKLFEEQLKTEVAQRSKIYSDIAVNNAQQSKLKAETGVIINPVTGASMKPLTDVQAKDLLYAQRGEQANSIIDNLQNKIVSMSSVDYTTQKALESNSLTSGNVSSEIKQLRQAERNFATAVLRKESGAAISPSEFATVEKQYFPRPGDDTQTLAQKKQNRETYISGTKSGVPGYDARVSTPESSYLDTVTKSLNVVSQKTDPVSIYTSKLIGLPGVK